MIFRWIHHYFTGYFQAVCLAFSLISIVANAKLSHAFEIAWQGFEFDGGYADISLEDAIAAAVLNETIVAGSELDIDSANATVIQAQSAFDPSVKFNVTGQENDNRVTDLIVTSKVVGVDLSRGFVDGSSVSLEHSYAENDVNSSGFPLDGDSVSTTLSYTKPLMKDAGPLVNLLAINKAKSNLTTTKLSQIKLLETKAREVSKAYWNHWLSFQRLEIAIDQFDLSGEQIELANKLAKAGMVAEIEVLRSESGRATRRHAIYEAQKRIFQTNMTFAGLVNGVNDTGLQILYVPKSPKDQQIPSFNRRELRRLAANNAINLNILREKARIAGLEKNAKEWQLKPDLDFVATTKKSKTAAFNDYYRSETANSLEWSASIVLTVPLGNRAAKQRFRVAENTQAKLEYAVLEERKKIQKSVNTTVDDVMQNQLKLSAAKKELELASEIYDFEVRLFETGFRTSTEVLNAAQTIAAARNKIALARMEYALSLVDLDLITGKIRIRVDKSRKELPERALLIKDLTQLYRQDPVTLADEETSNDDMSAQKYGDSASNSGATLSSGLPVDSNSTSAFHAGRALLIQNIDPEKGTAWRSTLERTKIAVEKPLKQHENLTKTKVVPSNDGVVWKF